eukprot:363024_1
MTAMQFEMPAGVLNILDDGSVPWTSHSSRECYHNENPSFTDDFPNIVYPLDVTNNQIDVICLPCSIKLLVKSDYAKLFKTIIKTWNQILILDAENGYSPLSKYIGVLNYFIKIMSHPQIQHFMQRSRKLFSRVVKITFFGFQILQHINTCCNNLSTITWFVELQLDYFAFIRYALIWYRKHHHLECIIKLDGIHFMLKTGELSLFRYIIAPFIIRVCQQKKTLLFPYSITMIRAMLKYKEDLLRNPSLKISDRMNECVVSFETFLSEKCVDTSMLIGRSKMEENYDMVAKLHRYFSDIYCDNKSCKKSYCFDKYGTSFGESAKPHWIENNIDIVMKPLSKWYICKGCHLTFYCSRKCQKFDWVRNNHKCLCQSIQLH